MSSGALLLTLVAAVCHALWNAAARGARSDGSTFVLLYSACACVLWVPIALVWLVVGDHAGVSPVWLAAGAATGLLHAAYGVVLQRGYRRGDLSLVYPVARGVGPLLTLVVSVAVLGQRPSPVSALGAVVVVSGIAVISAPERVGDRPRGSTAVRVGLGWGAATGVSIAAYTLFDAFSVNRLEVPPLAYYPISLVVTTLVLVPPAWRSGRAGSLLGDAWRVDRRPAVVVAVLSPLAYLLVLEAVRMAPVALVAATRESSIVLGTALGVLVFGEPGGARRAVGSVVVLIGIALVALG